MHRPITNAVRVHFARSCRNPLQLSRNTTNLARGCVPTFRRIEPMRGTCSLAHMRAVCHFAHPVFPRVRGVRLPACCRTARQGAETPGRTLPVERVTEVDRTGCVVVAAQREVASLLSRGASSERFLQLRQQPGALLSSQRRSHRNVRARTLYGQRPVRHIADASPFR